MSNIIDASDKFAARREGISVRYPQAAEVAPIEATAPAPAPAPAPSDFADEMAHNAAVKERLRKARIDANKAVLRSYRIKS